MPNLIAFVGHWGYPAIFLVVVLGNVGVPVPEETILGLAGYLVWRGELRLSIVLMIGVLSAVVGDNIGYWLGRKYGRTVIKRHATTIMPPQKLESAERLIERYGSYGVFFARFVPVARFMSGPLSGATGLKFTPFFVANLLGASLYVPLVVGMGYGVGYGLGRRIEALRHITGQVEHIIIVAALIITLLWVGWRFWIKSNFVR